MDKNISFEEALSKLEDAANQLKSGKLGLEDSIKLYENSIEYYNYCNEILKNAKQKIEMFNPQTEETELFGEY